MYQLTVLITRFLAAIQACSSSPLVQWFARILALSQAFVPAGWPAQYHLKDGESFDFVVVGAGSAGAIVAARLSEIPHIRALLVEAGGDPPLASVIPGLFVTLTQTEYDWDYRMKVDKGVARAHVNRSISLIRGKMLGGCSSNNYELYARGEPLDYDEWGEVAPGWDWTSTLQYFKKFENMTDTTVSRNLYNSYLHSTDGPVKISRPITNAYLKAHSEKILQSFEEIGIKRVLEMNGPETLGVSTPHFTFADSRRSSTAEAYLRKTKDRPNLFVAKHTRALRVLIDPYTLRAYGVELMSKSGNLVKVIANKEVILSAGAIESPKLLMLSGVGPKEELRKFDIHTIADLPVGSNLHDHQFIPLIFTGKHGFQSVLQGTITSADIKSLPAAVQNAFINLDNGNRRQLQVINSSIGVLSSPVLQLICELVSFKPSFCGSISRVNLDRAIEMVMLVLLHPMSRGRVTLRSNNPLDDPLIDSGFLNHEDDVRVLTKGIKFIRRLVNTSYYRHVQAGMEKLDVPGCDNRRLKHDEYWRCYVKNSVGSLQHPVGTCFMGPDGVVDERLRVNGVSGLRVIDASVMPTIPGGNTNAPAMMIGEKGADIIKEDYGLLYANEVATFRRFGMHGLHEWWLNA